MRLNTPSVEVCFQRLLDEHRPLYEGDDGRIHLRVIVLRGPQGVMLVESEIVPLDERRPEWLITWTGKERCVGFPTPSLRLVTIEAGLHSAARRWALREVERLYAEAQQFVSLLQKAGPARPV